MQNGQCLKCGSRTVFRSVGEGAQSPLHTGSGSFLINIYKDSRWVPDIDLLTLASYLCRSCGYLEMYVEDVAALEKLDTATNWVLIP